MRWLNLCKSVNSEIILMSNITKWNFLLLLTYLINFEEVQNKLIGPAVRYTYVILLTDIEL